MQINKKNNYKPRPNRQKGQSMVEYALGLGCVAGLCMVALGALGHISGDMIYSVESAIMPDKGDQAGQPGQMINRAATPWNFN